MANNNVEVKAEGKRTVLSGAEAEVVKVIDVDAEPKPENSEHHRITQVARSRKYSKAY